MKVKPLEDRPDGVVILGQLMIFLGITIISAILFTILGMFAGYMVEPFDIKKLMNESETLAGTMSLYGLKVMQLFSAIGTFLIPAYIISRILSNRPWNFMGTLINVPAWHYLLALLLFFVSYPFLAYTIELNQQIDFPDSLKKIEDWMKGMQEQQENLTRMMVQANTFGGFLMNILVIAVTAAVAEEFFFRGVMQRVFNYWWRRPHLAIWLTAFIFSAIHMQFYGFIPRLLLGLVLGYLFYWSGSIWVPVLFHFVNNFLVVLAFYLYGIGVITTQPDDMEAVPAYIGIISLLLAIPLIYFIRKKFTDKRPVNDAEILTENKPEETGENFTKIYTTNQLHKAEILVSLLENRHIKGFIMNKKDSAYNFGEIEVYVTEENAEQARAIVAEYEK